MHRRVIEGVVELHRWQVVDPLAEVTDLYLVDKGITIYAEHLV
ncbi:hypothetical protein [Weeksella virosa]|nr:hypothetical protein [Weeksella virosa]